VTLDNRQRLAVANGPNIFQMLLVVKAMNLEHTSSVKSPASSDTLSTSIQNATVDVMQFLASVTPVY